MLDYGISICRSMQNLWEGDSIEHVLHMGSYKEGNYAAGAHDQCKDLYTTTQKQMKLCSSIWSSEIGTVWKQTEICFICVGKKDLYRQTQFWK